MMGQRMLPLTERRQVTAEIKQYVSASSFGLIPIEISRYLKGLFPAHNFTDSSRQKVSVYHTYNLYIQTPAWATYSMALLQAGQGGSGLNVSRFQHTKTSNVKRNMLSAHLTNTTGVVAPSRVAALSRVFFEIDDVFETMKKEKDIALGCGYAILWLLYKKQEPLDMPEIMEMLGYPNTRTVEHSLFRESKIHPLREQGFLAEDKGVMELTEPVSIALSLMEHSRTNIRNLSGRVKWFYPTMKRKYEKPAVPTVLSEPPKYLPQSSEVGKRQVSYPF